ncbi:E3 ubiquitin-protein ligase ATL6-like [Carica papaya]|uniref:E3 ubiquitin-protein ligase ATL6-like n=1 Tax=Carica papaya TaxID=3649 RepID=UPI000B8C783A|nr:E3 ubiquitin-protein ligase ATL6-like [Carica papaya]
MISALKFRVCSAKRGMFSLALLLLFLGHLSPVAAQLSPPDPFQNPRFNPSMAIIVVVLISAMFFMAFFSIYIRHCSDSNNAGSVRPLAVLSRRLAAARGLDRAVIEKFPTFVYSDVKGLKIGKGALECAVCLCEFEDDETLRLIPKCDHVFHPDCIDAWLASHTTCPVCRANLTPQPEDENSPAVQPTESSREENDIESQNDAVLSDHENDTVTENAGSAPPAPEQQVVPALKRNRTRGSSRSGISFIKFLRSNSTGHSVVQPGENTERFTLRLPVEVRKQILKDRKLNRATSLIVLPGEASSRRGYRTGVDGGSSRGKSSSYRRIDQPERLIVKSDRWVFLRTPSFFSRASSFKSPRVAANDGEGMSTMLNGPGAQGSDSGRLPV